MGLMEGLNTKDKNKLAVQKVWVKDKLDRKQPNFKGKDTFCF